MTQRIGQYVRKSLNLSQGEQIEEGVRIRGKKRKEKREKRKRESFRKAIQQK